MNNSHREPAGEVSPDQLTVGIIRGGAPYSIVSFSGPLSVCLVVTLLSATLSPV